MIATNVGGNSEAIIERETGFWAPVKSPERIAELIVRLLNDKALAARLGKAGRKRIEKHFSLNKMIESHQALYSALAAKSRRAKNFTAPNLAATERFGGVPDFAEAAR